MILGHARINYSAMFGMVGVGADLGAALTLRWYIFMFIIITIFAIIFITIIYIVFSTFATYGWP